MPVINSEVVQNTSGLGEKLRFWHLKKWLNEKELNFKKSVQG